MNDAVLIIWKCKPLQNPSETEHEEENCLAGNVYEENHRLEDECSSESSMDSNYSENLRGTTPCVPCTVVFKCIGATKDTQSQDALCTAKDRISSGWTVPVRMRPEPTNIADSQAIVFECELDGKWRKIGYVVRNILNEVHAAMGANLIISACFKCIKYVTHWSHSGPGYYAGISVTKSGPWDHKVKLFRSTI